MKKVIIPILCILLKIYWVSGNHVRKQSIGIIASQNRRNPAIQSLISSTASTIKLLDNQSQASQQLNNFMPQTQNNYNNPQAYYADPRQPDFIPHKKSGPLSSVLKGLGIAQSDPEENEPAEHDQPDFQPTQVEQHPAHEGWGWSKTKKKKHKPDKYAIGGGGGSNFSLLDLLLSGLSLISFGAFLVNLMASLFSILFGSGLFSTTSYPYYTSGMGMGGAGGGGAGGGGAVAVRFVNSIPSFFRNDLTMRNKNHGSGTIHAEAGIGNTIKGGWTESSREEPDFDDEDISDSAELTSDREFRTKRSTIWEPTIHPYDSLNIVSKSILNSIESMHSNYVCMEKVVCDSNRHAKIIRSGLEYFMPIYTFSTSYFGQKLGLHSNLPAHLRAIVLGVREANCNTNFPQCSHSSTVANSFLVR